MRAECFLGHGLWMDWRMTELVVWHLGGIREDAGHQGGWQDGRIDCPTSWEHARALEWQRLHREAGATSLGRKEETREEKRQTSWSWLPDAPGQGSGSGPGQRGGGGGRACTLNSRPSPSLTHAAHQNSGLVEMLQAAWDDIQWTSTSSQGHCSLHAPPSPTKTDAVLPLPWWQITTNFSIARLQASPVKQASSPTGPPLDTVRGGRRMDWDKQHDPSVMDPREACRSLNENACSSARHCASWATSSPPGLDLVAMGPGNSCLIVAVPLGEAFGHAGQTRCRRTGHLQGRPSNKLCSTCDSLSRQPWTVRASKVPTRTSMLVLMVNDGLCDGRTHNQCRPIASPRSCS